MIEFRPYQNDFIAAVAKGFADSFRRQLGVLPTGGGKTLCFAGIAHRFHKKRAEKSLILAHREELVNQAADKVHKVTGLRVEIEKADQRATRDADVVVASVQTLQRSRLESWPRDHFGLVVADEAHHALAEQWQTTINYFDARVLGVTATPDRGDKRSLATFFDNLAYECTILDLIKQGYLAPVMVKSIPLKIDISKVAQLAGDLDSGGIASAIEPYLDTIAQCLAALPDRKILVFLPLIETSKKFVAACERAGVTACHVDGNSPDRAEILAKYGKGEFRCLCNAMLLTEGYDEPSIDCVVVLRPTKSRSLLAQMVGRGTRLHPGKGNLLLLDFLWLHEKHNLAKAASLVAKSEAEEESISKVLEKGDETDLAEAVGTAEAEREAALIRELAEGVRRKERYVSLENVAALLKDTKMREYAPVMGWETKPATQGQRTTLERFHIKCPPTMGEASMLLDRLFNRSKEKLATVGQVALLQKFRHPDPVTCTAKEAKAFLDEKFSRSRSGR